MSQSDLDGFARPSSNPASPRLGLAAAPGAGPATGEPCTLCCSLDAGETHGSSWETAWIDLGGEG